MSSSKIDPEIFLEAAELLEKGPISKYRGACWAIEFVAGYSNFLLPQRFLRDWFEPPIDPFDKKADTLYWLWRHDRSPEENLSHRVMTLILAAVLAEEGEDL